MPRQHIQPDALSKRVVNGHVLYSHVVTVEGGRLIFISGQLARDQQGNVVGKGDMRAQLRQVGENLKAAAVTWSSPRPRSSSHYTDHLDADYTSCHEPPRDRTLL